jgi:putative membrane protein
MHHGYWDDGGGDWWWIPMTLMMIAFWGGLAWVAVTLIRHNAHRPAGAPPAPPYAAPPSPPSPPSDPREILADRLARGEIEIDDYRARVDALEHSPPRARGA